MRDNTRQLNGFSSIFLDALRLLCAFVVVIGHCRQILTPAWSDQIFIFKLGHGAVIVFFVLSGFVIAHTTSSKKRTLNEYLVARFARLYSIYIPALLITIVCAFCVLLINKAMYFQYDRGENIIRYLLTLVFCNELWFSSAAPPMNGPFWSLSFEFWYYILFALIYFRWRSNKGILLIVIVCLLTGPKILLMFPVWCLGWLAYKANTLPVTIATAWLLTLIFLAISIACMKWLPDYPGVMGDKPFYMANAFITDSVTGIFMAASLWLLPTNTEGAIKDSAFLKKFRTCANITYALYLFHFPILVTCNAILQSYHFSNISNYCIGITATLAICFLLGGYFEAKKSWWHHFFERLIYNKKISFRPTHLPLPNKPSNYIN